MNGCIPDLPLRLPTPARPTPDSIAGTWIGFACKPGYELPLYEQAYYRLILERDGTGLCAFTGIRYLGEEKVRLYQVSRLRFLGGHAIEIDLKPTGANANPITMMGTATYGSLHLEVSDGTTDGWRGHALFQRESEVESNIEAIKKRMNE